MMCFKKQAWYTAVLVTATVWLSGCSSINANSVEQQPALISDQQVKEYVQQWHSQQESITRLAAMEEDLQLLIMALSSQTDIAENPAVLREDNVTVAHYAEKIQTPDTANSSKNYRKPPFATVWQLTARRATWAVFKTTESENANSKVAATISAGI